jgi:Flp pilus assembly pilin Flp
MSLTGHRLSKFLRTLVQNEDGAALIEYGMLVMLIALLCIVALKTIGSKVANGFNSANTLLP